MTRAAWLVCLGILSGGLGFERWSWALPIQCSDPKQGPCLAADTFDLQFDPAGRPTVAMNFGVLMAGVAGGYTHVCEEAFGGRSPQSMAVTATGFVLMPAPVGLYRSHPSNKCSWTLAQGVPENTFVHQVVTDPSLPTRVWALVGVGNQRGLYVSHDEGARFELRYAFPSGQVWWSVEVVGPPANRIYVAGPGAGDSFSLGVSVDEGRSFVVRDVVDGLSDPVRRAILLGASMEAKPRLFFARDTAAAGDEIWVSTDDGFTATRTLALPAGHIEGGFTFGATPQTVYVASRVLLISGRAEDAALFVSLDGGLTWSEPVNGGSAGPRFRCLKWREGMLYACGGGVDASDAFYVARSVDGKSWDPVVVASNIEPTPACLRERCLDTTAWLCSSYGICASSADGGVGDAGSDPPRASGCGCQVGKVAGTQGSGLSGLMLLGLVALRRLGKRRAKACGVRAAVGWFHPRC